MLMTLTVPYQIQNAPLQTASISLGCSAVQVGGQPPVPIPRASTWFEEEAALRLIADLESLEVGWDGYGAIPIPSEVRNNALAAISQIAAWQGKIPVPTITPRAVGTIGLTWEGEMGEAYLELGKTRITGFIEKPASPDIFIDGEASNIEGLVFVKIYESLFGSRSNAPVTDLALAI